MIILKYPNINGVSIEFNRTDGMIDSTSDTLQIIRSVEETVQEQLSHSYDFVRIGIPSEWGIQKILLQQGYLIVDRTIQTKVSLQKKGIDFNRYCRMEVEQCMASSKEIFRIAESCFRNDCRFQLDMAHMNGVVYRSILHQWIKEQTKWYICRFKGKIIGFADVRITAESAGNPFVYLAAVDQNYRTTGAAMSLYASVFLNAKGSGYSNVYGRISSRNTAVLNLYSSFDAVFSEPMDIYIKGEAG